MASPAISFTIDILATDVYARSVPLLAARQDSTIAEPSSSTSVSLEPAPSDLYQLPRPFDASIGNNFTAPSCPAFFSSFLDDHNFQLCSPFSLLLQTSSSFFSMSRSPVAISQTMDTSCKIDYPACSSLMSNLASELQQSSHCGQDLKLQNPLVVQAYNGLLAYDSLYLAGCLKNRRGGYCYGDAMMNTTDPSTYYIYYLPLGVQLPPSAQPSCNECLKNTMTVFASSASNSSKPLSQDYLAAAKIINQNCGPSFVQATIVSSSASRQSITWHGARMWLIVTLLTVLLAFI